MAKKYDFRPHKAVRKDGALKGYEVTPHTRLKSGDNPPIYVRAGRYYDDGGNELEGDEVPEWVHEHLRLMTNAARVKHGFPERMDAKPHASVAKGK